MTARRPHSKPASNLDGTADASGRTRTPHITVRLPRCPNCGSTRLKPYKRIQKAGFKVHYSKCVDCSENVNLDIL